jgi:hypothetical protein
MSFTVERNGYVSVQALGRAVADDLIANGFNLVAVNGSDVTPATSDSTTYYVFEPTAAVDPVDTSWRLVMQATDADSGYIRFWACHELQIDPDTFTVVANGQTRQSGHMYAGNEVVAANSKLVSRQWNHSNWSCYKFQGIDPRAIPLSYRLSVSDHGVSFFVWAEAFDGNGDCFSWFTVQRPVNKDGTVVTTGKLPLFCVFSWQGGGDTDIALSENLNAVGDRILKFVVYESDVNAPSTPLSACVSGPDSKAIINPIQQIGLAEDNKYTLFFPQGVTTQRYVYPYELDMICFTSADVISQNEVAEITLYGEGTPRKYIGMQANFPNNAGMRMLCLVEGSGIPAA